MTEAPPSPFWRCSFYIGSSPHARGVSLWRRSCGGSASLMPRESCQVSFRSLRCCIQGSVSLCTPPGCCAKRRRTVEAIQNNGAYRSGQDHHLGKGWPTPSPPGAGCPSGRSRKVATRRSMRASYAPAFALLRCVSGVRQEKEHDDERNYEPRSLRR